jgi:hypothetical protein
MTREDIEQTQAEAQRQRESLYRRAFNTEAGMSVLRDLAAHFRYESSSFEGDFNTHKAALHDGQKSVIREILKLSQRPTQDARES